MVDSLAKLNLWLADRQWSDNTLYDADNEHAEFATGLLINGIHYGLTVHITDQPLWASVKLSPLFIINGVQLAHVDTIIETINSQLQGANFRTYLRDGYSRLRYRASAPLDEGLQPTEAIGQLVDAGIAACAAWVPSLRAVGTSSRDDAASLREMLISQPTYEAPEVQQIISADEYDKRWESFLDAHPSPARSLSSQYGWLAQRESEFHAALSQQGVLTDR